MAIKEVIKTFPVTRGKHRANLLSQDTMKQAFIGSRVKIVVEGTGIDKKLTIRDGAYHTSVPVSEISGGTSLSCDDVAACEVIQDVLTDLGTLTETVNGLPALSALVHGDHVNITATWDALNEEVILTGTGGGGTSFSCTDVATCIQTNTDVQDELIARLEGLTGGTLDGDFTFSGNLTFSGTIEGGTYNNSTLNNPTITGNSLSTPITVTSISHGFTALDWLRFDEGTGEYVKAQANATGNLGSRHVIDVTDADTFTVAKDGTFTIANILTPGEYVLSATTAGAYTQTAPTTLGEYILYGMEVIDGTTINFYSVVGIGAAVQEQVATTQSLVDKNTFMLGEDCLLNDSLFVETTPTWSDISSLNIVQNIGDVTANTRVNLYGFGSGVPGNTMKLALKKFSSPSFNLSIRLEELDTNGNPTGMLVDSISSAATSITAASLTTSLVDTTITFPGTFAISLGKKFGIVLAQVDDTINLANYYGVGISNKNTTTRTTKIHNGTGWGSVFYKNDPFTYSTLPSFWTKTGTVGLSGTNLTFTGNTGTIFTNNLKSSETYNTDMVLKATVANGYDASGNSNAPGIVIWFSNTNYMSIQQYYSAGTLRTTATIIEGGVSAFSQTVGTAGEPKIVYNRISGLCSFYMWSGSVWTQIGTTTSVGFSGNYNLMITASGTASLGVPTSTLDNFYATSYDYSTLNPLDMSGIPYTSSSIFMSNLLSKTNATYSYKIPTDFTRIANEAKSAGQNVITTYSGLKDGFTGLTPVTYYISDTPGLLSTTAGSNLYSVGTGISSTTLQLAEGLGVTVRVSRDVNTVYRAGPKGGILISSVSSTFNTDRQVSIYSDSTTNPTTLVGDQRGYNSTGSGKTQITCVILPNHYYKTTVSGTFVESYFYG